jgi:hypothetical protein
MEHFFDILFDMLHFRLGEGHMGCEDKIRGLGVRRGRTCG